MLRSWAGRDYFRVGGENQVEGEQFNCRDQVPRARLWNKKIAVKKDQS